MNGAVDPNGEATVCEFRYTTWGAGTHRVPCSANPGSGDVAVPVSARVVGVLDPEPVVQLVAFNRDGGTYGEELPVPSGHLDFHWPPIVTTDPATTVSSVGAALNGTVDPQGSPTTCSFDYGPTPAYGHTVQCAQAPGSAAGSVPVSADIPASTPYVDVHYRLRATNGEGTTVAYDRLVVVGDPPVHSAATGDGGFSWVAGSGSGALTLRGTVDPNGSATACEFEYGPTLAFGHTVACATESGAAAEPVEVSAVVGGMPVETAFEMARYFRLVAGGESGMSKGAPELVTPEPEEDADPDPDPCVSYPAGLGCGTPPDDSDEPPPDGQGFPSTQTPGTGGSGQTGSPQAFAARRVSVTGLRGRLIMGCRADRGSRCTGRLRLTRRPRPGGPLPQVRITPVVRWILGTGRYDLAAGERRTVRVELTPVGRRLLARAGGTLRARLIGAGLERRRVELRAARR